MPVKLISVCKMGLCTQRSLSAVALVTYGRKVTICLHQTWRIYIIITKNIRYLLWNQGVWRLLKNTYTIFLTPCIRCTNHLCDPCGLIDVNPHFIPSLLPMIQNVDLLWRHRYNGRQQSWRHKDRLFPRGFYGRFFSTITDVEDNDLTSKKTRLCHVFQNLWSREMFGKWRHD